ncbi:hypothetical protein [Methylorubrum aminovorans]
MNEKQIGEFLDILGEDASMDDVEVFADYLPRLHGVGKNVLPYLERYFVGDEARISAAVILGLHVEGRLGEIIENGRNFTRHDREWEARRQRAREIVMEDPMIVAMVLEEEHPDKFRVVDLLEEAIQAEVAAEKAAGTHQEYDSGPHILADHPNPIVASCFREETPKPSASSTVSEARKSFAARTGRSMRSVIAQTIGMGPEEIDRLAA